MKGSDILIIVCLLEQQEYEEKQTPKSALLEGFAVSHFTPTAHCRVKQVWELGGGAGGR